jgi:uncharacterized protein (DUF983 family)
MKKGSNLYAITKFKCPRCHEGELYPSSTFSFERSFDMHKRCGHCDANFFPEPGFYYGAMFISYIFSGFFCIFFLVITMLALNWNAAVAIGSLLLIMAIYFVWLFRFARAIWLSINLKYDPSMSKKD